MTSPRRLPGGEIDPSWRWEEPEREELPIGEVITRPTRDLNGGRRRGGRRGGGRRGGGRRDYDIDLRRWEPMSQRPRRGRDESYSYMETEKERGRRGRRGGRREWWNEPRRPEPRREYPTEFSDRLASDAERMRLLTGESDLRKGPLRDNYDPVDIDFNRQFSEAPRGRQPWHSDPTGNPLERDPLSDYDVQGGRSTSPQRYSEQIRPIEEKKEEKFQPSKPKRNVKNRGKEKEARIQPIPSPPSIPEPPKEPEYGRWQDAELPTTPLTRTVKGSTTVSSPSRDPNAKEYWTYDQLDRAGYWKDESPNRLGLTFLPKGYVRHENYTSPSGMTFEEVMKQQSNADRWQKEGGQNDPRYMNYLRQGRYFNPAKGLGVAWSPNE